MKQRFRTVIRRRVLVSAAIAALSGGWVAALQAQTLPSGGVVVGGLASITQTSPTQLNINASTTRSAINWQDFSIGAGYGVSVQQPNATSMQLENVVGNNVSQIFGSLSSNGRVVIANPNGIWFGPSAQIDVAGLAATTAHPTATDIDTFTAGGNLALSQPGNATAAVVNQGTITVGQEGLAALVAPGVSNDGIIQAKLGTVHLASGTTATLDLYGDGLISLAVNGQTLARAINPATGKPVNAAVQNTGTLNADGGTVLLTANTAQNVVNDVINISGVVQARAVSQQGGTIVLNGGGTGTVQVAGSLDASGTGAGQTGGTVKVLGDNVHLASTASVDVSGDAGGGTALIGGNFHGAGPERNATTTTVDQGAIIRADAVTAGTGGNVAIWSDVSTAFDGAISARGGAQSGDGGQVETSGEQLAIGPDASVSTAAPAGQAGNWLLDPYDVTISTGTTTSDTCSGNHNVTCTPSGNAAVINNTALDNSLNSGNVTVNTGSSGTQNGDITIAAPISWSKGNTLTLTAANNITVNSSITSSSNGSLTMTASAGTVTIGAAVAMSGNSQSTITVNGSSGVIFNDGTGTAVSTAGNQTYTGTVTLDTDTTLSSTGSGGNGTITFNNNITGAHALTVTSGTTSFDAAVSIGALSLQAVTFDLASGSVSTTGGQTYSGAATLATNTTVTDSGTSGITFANTINSASSSAAKSLTINVGSGPITLAGNIGATHALGSVTLNSTGTTTLGGTVTAASLSTEAGGTTDLNGGTVTTTAAPGQVYGGAVVLGANTTLSATGTSAAIAFDGSVSGAHNLTVSTGATTFDNSVSIGALSLQAVTFDLASGSVSTTGGQTYAGAATLGADASLTDTNGGAITFNSTVNGGHALTTNTAGSTIFSGVVGGSTALASLSAISTGGTVTVANVATIGAQDYYGAAGVKLAGSSYTTSNSSIEFYNASRNTLATTTLTGSVTIGNSTTVWGPVLNPNGLSSNMTFNLSGGSTNDTTFTADVGNATTERIGNLSVTGGRNFTIANGATVYAGAFTDSNMIGLVNFGATLNVLNSADLSGNLTGHLTCATGSFQFSCIHFTGPTNGAVAGVPVELNGLTTGSINGFPIADVALYLATYGTGGDPQDKTVHLYNDQSAFANPGQAGCGQIKTGSCADHQLAATEAPREQFARTTRAQ